MKATRIVVLGTGGTIAGTAASADDNIGYTAAQVGVEQLLAAVPALRRYELHAEQVAQLDSKDMAFDVWARLAARCAHWLAQPEVQGLVITHGTDTLEETAYFLHAVLGAAKPVVLTCAMRPATALAPDGPQNLLDAVALAATPGWAGVAAVCAGTVHGATDVRKVHPYRLDAFDSGEAGPVGFMEEGSVRWLRPLDPAPAARAMPPEGTAWPRVEIVMSYAGASATAVDALAQAGIQGLVVAATGNGTLHVDLQAALLRAQARGVAVRRSTRCMLGRIIATPGQVLPDAPAGLSPVKARVALWLELLG